MKKSISIIIALSMLLSMFTALTFNTSAAGTANDNIITKIDFESEQQKKFYMNDNGTVREENVYTADEKGIREETIYSDVKSTVAWLRRPYSTVGNADNEPWASSMRLCDADGEALKLEAGNRVSLTADVKVNNKNSNIKHLYLGIVFTTHSCVEQAKKWGSWNDSVRAYYENGKLIQLADISNINGWQRVGGTITVPEHSDDELPMLVFYSTEDFNANSHYNAEMWLDEIIVSEYVETSGIVTKIDFEPSKQLKFYMNDDGTVREENVYTADAKGIREETIYSDVKSTVVWLRRPYSATDNEDRSPWASSMRLCDANGEALKLKAGDKISLTADVKVNRVDKNTNIKHLYLGIVFTKYSCNEQAQKRGSWNDGVRAYYENGKLIQLADISNINGWQRVGGTITVPAHEENELPMLVYYSTENFDANNFNQPEMWIDNITVDKCIDVNGDKAINILDLVALKKKIVATDYSVIYDINSDGLINTSDLVILRKELLK